MRDHRSQSSGGVPIESPRRVKFGEFVFDLETGELRRAIANGETSLVERLGPQPALLLALLIERKGELVSREEIRARLWPDVTVDFESGLHFCARQVRSALGDTARTPQYIETLPRRGYRLLVTPDEIDGIGDHTTRRRRRPVFVALVVIALVASCLITLALWNPPDTLRLAIMPFEAPAALSFPFDTAPVAELVLAKLVSSNAPSLGIIGPTTTQAYAGRSDGKQRLVDELSIGYVVNGRFAVTDDGPLMLAELIRGSDGVHVWVGRFHVFDDLNAIADTIVEHVITKLVTARRGGQHDDPHKRIQEPD